MPKFTQTTVELDLEHGIQKPLCFLVGAKMVQRVYIHPWYLKPVETVYESRLYRAL